jgi:predicted phosphodiesterase
MPVPSGDAGAGWPRGSRRCAEGPGARRFAARPPVSRGRPAVRARAAGFAGTPRGALAALAVTLGLTLLVGIGCDRMADWRIRLHTLVRIEGPPGPEIVTRDGVVFSVTGCRARQGGPRAGLALRAWSADPVIRIVDPGAGETTVVVRVENLPVRARLDASGPVEEVRSGLVRTLRFSARATRRVAFQVPDDDVQFAALGDTGDAPTFHEALRVAAADGADFFLHLGDLIYEDAQMPAIRRILDDAPLPVFVVRGNHDYRNRARIEFMRELGPPYYAFRLGRATIVVLDNADDYLPGLWRHSGQYRWWTGVAGASRDGPLLVAMHKPIRDRRDARSRAEMNDRALGRQLLTDFARAGVDAVLTGHVHATHLWVEGGIPFVVDGEGSMSRTGLARARMGWVHVHGWRVQIDQVPISRRPARPTRRRDAGRAASRYRPPGAALAEQGQRTGS